MRLTNVDTLSALIDRLICERIKLFFFEKDNKVPEIIHQREIISELRVRIADLFNECFEQKGYSFMAERRTFDENAIVDMIDKLVVNDIWIGEGDRARLSEISKPTPDLKSLVKNERITRTSNEGRAAAKNAIDGIFAGLFKVWKKKKQS